MSHLSEDRFEALVADERNRELPPLNSWPAVAQRARAEGLLRDDGQRRWSAGKPWLQAAAAVVILAGGIAVGRATTAIPFESTATTAPVTTPAAVVAAPASIRTVDEAWQTLDRASAEYQAASAFLAANNGVTPALTDSIPIYRARLAALEALMSASATARENARNDPVINQYYLAALGAREATAQQLRAVRPANLLKGF